jgi:hypothetical protein
MSSNQIFGIVVALIAMFTFVASSLNLEFFFKNRRAQTFVKLFGRRGAQIFYMALGAFLFYVAYQVYFGDVPV